MKQMISNLIALISRNINLLIGGTKGESLSGRSYRQRFKWQWCIARNLINALFCWQDDHCFLVHTDEKMKGVVK